MRQIQLEDGLYEKAELHAAESGFPTVDEYIADVVSQDLAPDPLGPEFFTPERLAHLDQISAEIKAGGKTHTLEEVQKHFDRKSEQWLKAHGS